MNWIISTNTGDFEGETKREVLDGMITYYIDNDETPETIQAIHLVKRNAEPAKICQETVSEIQGLVDEGFNNNYMENL